MILALSTCWNSSRHTSGETMLNEIRDLGFDHVELSHGINLSLIEGVIKVAERGGLTFTSLHNFCPQPVEVMSDSPDCYEFSSGRDEVRHRAIKMTLQTLDYAKRLHAKRVVLHLGSVSEMRGFTRGLINTLHAGEYLSKAYAEQKLEGVIERESRSPVVLTRVAECLKPIIDTAGEYGIRLGIENRDSYESVPSEREFPELLDELGPVCGYWHDFGHAQRKANLSLLDHEDWVRAMGSRAIGCHVHDARWPIEDHCVPFSGDIDFHALVPHFPKDIPYVIELHPKHEASQVVEAARRWREEFGE